MQNVINRKLEIDTSKMKFGDEYLLKIEPMIEKALKEMEQIEAGAIANIDENWMVGHYWLRNPELAPEPKIKNSIESTINQIKVFSKKLISGQITSSSGARFKDIILIGIGGSALGNLLLQDALKTGEEPFRIHFFDNTDPDGFEKFLKEIPNLSETLGIVVSKSGTTIEPRNGQLYFAEILKNQNLDPSKHLVAITKEDSRLYKTAKGENWIEIFPMWDWVGGRTSLWASVGLLPMCLQQRNIDDFLKGASEMDSITRNKDLHQNPAMQLAVSWYHAGCGKGLKSMVILPYRDRLLLFSRYLQQLVMESLGKEKDRDGNIVNQGLTVYGNKGSTDQHAFVQQLRDGISNFFVVFVRTLEGFKNDKINNKRFLPVNFEVESGVTSEDYLHAYYLGTRKALSDTGRESLTITLTDISEYSLGQLIAVFERAVGFYASFINVNAYNQPGVEAGKKAAIEILTVQKEVIKIIKNKNGGKISLKEIHDQVDQQKIKQDLSLIYEILEPFVGRGEIKCVQGVQLSDNLYSF